MATTAAALGSRLREIKTFPSLVKYLRDELEWPIESDDFEDVTFDWQPEELGIDPENAAKIQEIKQLRPFVSQQPWGIFFVKFEPRKLPVVALRRILRALVIKRRAMAKNADRKSWEMNDLLFISLYGGSDHREIAFAHFAEESDLGDLPTLRVLGWDDENTALHLDHADQELREKLRWSDDDEDDIENWRRRWSSAFSLRIGEVVSTAKLMAERLAELAGKIRKRVNSVLKIEADNGALRKLHKAFREALIHDLSEDDFADMYAQTISYGLLTARISRPSGLVGDNLRDMVPVTNPFLRDLLETFMTVGGRKGKIDFDELGVSEVVKLLRDADMEAVLRDFGDRNPQEDPAIHFYELFLKEYDPEKRVKRGVFYTPRPVVSYIVRSIHELLQTEFGLPEGLASTATWAEMAKRHPGLEIPKGSAADSPFVQILDPAVGTGTFLVEVIDVVHKTMLAKWQKDGRMPLEVPKLWNEYVSKDLLPRLHGYELMMAPYAIAHMKIGLKLHETGYRFGSDERARIYLTNSLEPPQDFSDRLAFDAPALAHEAQAVNAIKRHHQFTVVLGNPPYSRASNNRGEYIEGLMDLYKSAVRSERNIQPLSDDYLKFIRLGQMIAERAHCCIFSMITNNTFFSGRIHRGVRQQLQSCFGLIRVLNLHGSLKVAGPGSEAGREPDANVFDIQQGVGIWFFSKGGTSSSQIGHAEMIGSRELKYSRLAKDSVKSTKWKTLGPREPYYLWIPREDSSDSIYQTFTSLEELFTFYSVSGKPGEDSALVSIDRDDVLPKLRSFRDRCRTEKTSELSEAGRKLAAIAKEIRFVDTNVIRYAYRPFDDRWTYYDARIWTRALSALKQHVADAPILLTTKLVKDGSFEHVFVTRLFADVIFLSNRSSVNCYSFPLILVDGPVMGRERKRCNLRLDRFAKALGEEPAPEQALNWIYAILHSPSYRRLYFDELQYDFARIPLTRNSELFRDLSEFGAELIAAHLMESRRRDGHLTTFVGSARPQIEKVSYEEKTVWINKDQTCGFQGVPRDVWDFHIGGYQVCEKWLKDRKGRVLSKADIEHYQRIVVALAETIRLMKEVDEVIDKHGGWPAAFSRRGAIEDLGTDAEAGPSD